MRRLLRSCQFVRLLIVVGSIAAACAIAAPTASAHTGEADKKVVDEAAQEEPAAEPSEVWGCPMCETVREASPGKCPKCAMALVRMDAAEPEQSAGTTASVQPAEARARSLMPGLPDWMFYAGALGVLALSFILFEVAGRRRAERPRGRRIDLFRIPGVRRLVRWRGFVPAIQLPVVLIFVVVLLAGLIGRQEAERNIAPALTWTLWWTWLIFVVIFLGKAWCTVCPWMALADWTARLGRLRPSGKPFGLGLRWPRRLRNIWLATGLFLLLTWLELGFGVTGKPWLTATMGLLMVLASLGTLLVFERKAFCRYACLVGRVSGLYSMFSASEIRPTDRSECRSCSTRDCYHGNGRADACPTHQFLGAMDANTYCTQCLECVRSCPQDNVSWNLRPPGADLMEVTRTRVDEAYLSVILLAMSAFHGLTMTPAWDRLVEAIQALTGTGWLTAFSLGMLAMILLPVGLYYGVCWLMKALVRDTEHSARLLFIRFSYSLLPIALFYHLAHNLQHVFFEGKKVVRLASDPFGWNWDLFGTAHMAVDAVLPVSVGWSLQVALILIGHVFGILIAHRVAVSLYGDRRRATLSQVPMLAAMLLFSLQSLWLVAQPMLMRTAM